MLEGITQQVRWAALRILVSPIPSVANQYPLSLATGDLAGEGISQLEPMRGALLGILGK